MYTLNGGQLLDIGPRGFQQTASAATLSYTPISDREAYIVGIRIGGASVSAADIWDVTVGGRVVMSFFVNIATSSTVNQNVTGGTSTSAPRVWDLFRWYTEAYGDYITIPVPWGQTATVSSRGGATAGIEIEYEEVSKGTTNRSDLNHYEGNKFLIPIWAYRAATLAATAENAFDTQVAPLWVPSVYTGTQVQAGFEVDIMSLWFAPAGVNVYTGSADTQSVTGYVYAVINGQRYFTRNATGGFTAIGTASAAGSANKVFTGVLARFPAFQDMQNERDPMISPSINIKAGQTSTWGLGLTGTTLAADYSKSILASLALVTVL